MRITTNLAHSPRKNWQPCLHEESMVPKKAVLTKAAVSNTLTFELNPLGNAGSRDKKIAQTYKAQYIKNMNGSIADTVVKVTG